MDKALILDKNDGLKSYFLRDKAGEPKQIKHALSGRVLLFPFTTKISAGLANKLKPDFRHFDGFIGHSYRAILGKKIPSSLGKQDEYKKNLQEELLKGILEKTDHGKDLLLRNKLRAIVKNLFFEEDSLVRYGTKAFWYMDWGVPNSGLKNIAEFIVSVFFTDKVRKAFSERSSSSEHVLYRLINESLPQLEESTSNLKSYHILMPEVVEQFEDDFLWLAKDEKLLLKNIDRFFQFYFFIYISKSAFYLSDFFDGEKKDKYKLFFVLEQESYSNTRVASKGNWRLLESRISGLFSHAICLDWLNYLPSLNTEVDYKMLKEHYRTLSAQSQEQLLLGIDTLIEVYKEYIPKSDNIWVEKKGWDGFESYLEKHQIKYDEQTLEAKVRTLWHAIRYQFLNSGRKNKEEGYYKWFEAFCQAVFLKNRGRAGRSLNLTNDMLLFLTQLCMGDQPKIRLNHLWKQLELRGVFFDNQSKEAVTAFFEKINLLEKKSDSGDAQYVKSIQ